MKTWKCKRCNQVIEADTEGDLDLMIRLHNMQEHGGG